MDAPVTLLTEIAKLTARERRLAFDPDFDAMIERVDGLDSAGTRVVVVGKDDLIAMKRGAAADPLRRNGLP